MSISLLALLGFIGWTLSLLVLMEIVRSVLVLVGAVPANGFDPANSNLSPFMQRLSRAHANCLEGLPLFGGLLLIADVADKTHLTDPLAYALRCPILHPPGLDIARRGHRTLPRIRRATGDRGVLGGEVGWGVRGLGPGVDRLLRLVWLIGVVYRGLVRRPMLNGCDPGAEVGCVAACDPKRAFVGFAALTSANVLASP